MPENTIKRVKLKIFEHTLNIYSHTLSTSLPAGGPHCWPKQHGEAWPCWKHMGNILEVDYWGDKLEKQNLGENY